MELIKVFKRKKGVLSSSQCSIHRGSSSQKWIHSPLFLKNEAKQNKSEAKSC